jgi:hypothetical protein
LRQYGERFLYTVLQTVGSVTFVLFPMQCTVFTYITAKEANFGLHNSKFIFGAPYRPVLRSRSRKEPPVLVGAGAGAVTRCGSAPAPTVVFIMVRNLK